MSLRPKPRTLTSFLLRVLLPRTVLFGVGAAILGLGQVLAVNPSAALAEDTGVQTPTWTAEDRAAHPECTPASDWPAGAPAEHVVVHSFRDGLHHKVRFDRAWDANHNDTEVDDSWVLGVCG